MADIRDSGTTASPADPDLNLKKRARRRLVGAITLALLAVVVLPMVMDQEPVSENQDIQIRIPSQEPGAHNVVSRIATGTPQPPADDAATEDEASADSETTVETPPSHPSAPAAGKPVAPQVQAETKHAASPAAATPPAAAKPAAGVDSSGAKDGAKGTATDQAAERKRAMSLLNEEQWIIQLGAYQNQATVRGLQAKLKDLGYASYTEKIDTPKGPSTRVRCGPFPSRAAAEQAHAKLKKIAAGGPNGGTLAQLK